ncbi:MAG: aminotransferase class III-fold pyridoxal phosphate-dependent enzyme [Pseudomonadota bacterium]
MVARTDFGALLTAHWDLDGPLRALDGEHDRNLVAGHTVYKVMRAGGDEAHVALQVACLEHLAERELPVPVVVPTRNAARWVVVIDADGNDRVAWAVSRLPGAVLAAVRPRTVAMAHALGADIAELHGALADFEHGALPQTHEWDLRAAADLYDGPETLAGHPHAAALDQILRVEAPNAIAALQALPTQAIHNDLNDYNLLATCAPLGEPELSGFIDFGDMLAAPVICDLAIAGAYLVLGQSRPLDLLRALVAGYAAQRALSATEVALVWPLLRTRLAQSALIAWRSEGLGRDDPYLQVSQRPINDFFCAHAHADGRLVETTLLRAAGLETPDVALSRWLASDECVVAPVFAAPLADAPILDLSITGAHACDNPVQPDMADIERAVVALDEGGTRAVLGRYDEPRLVYGAPFYLAGTHGATDRRTIHIAIDVFLPAGTPVHAPLAATVHTADVRDADYDYGGLVVLRHETPDGTPFFTLYGHLAHDSVRALSEGQSIAAGQAFAALGGADENGGWPPHVHLQLGVTDAPGADWLGVVDPDQRDDWCALFPDPAPLLGLAPGHATAPRDDLAALAGRRMAHAPPSLRTSYREPLDIARGWRSLLFDSQGRTYLDAYNNVPHVGHAHPRVRAAVDAQMRFVNTNTRYLQRVHADYAAALAERLPDRLDTVFLLSSGSEANELALRLARTATGQRDTIVLAAGYHGHTVATIDISDYKFSGPGGEGAPDWVHVAPNPDAFRAGCDPNAAASGAHFADAVTDIVTALSVRDRQPACFIAETFPSVGGQLVPPPGWLRGIYAAVRAAGGVCIADEVQTGLGRLGTHFWGFEQQEVVPDIVVLGKPLGGGYPLAAVVTTRAIAQAFDTGMEFFATFGGSSVACAAGHEVLRIIDDEGLAAHAADVGGYLLEGLRALAADHHVLADVRGMGLFIGVEIADAARKPLANVAGWTVERLRQRRVLIGRDGPDHNVLKIRPPLAFDRADADYLLAVLSEVLGETAFRP